MAKINGTAVTTEEVRLSYVHLFAPYVSAELAKTGAKPKYSVTLLIDKKKCAQTIDLMNQAIENAKKAGIDKLKTSTGAMPPVVSTTFKDADATTDSDGIIYSEKHPEAKGCYVISVASEKAVKVVDGDKQEILDDSMVQSGDYANVAVNFYAYNFAGKKGISCGLQAVQFTRKGEPLGSAVDVNSLF